MEWKSVPISSICEGIYEGPHATPPSCDSGAYYLGIPALTIDGQIDFSKVPFISKEDYIKWTKRVTPQYGDIVFTNEATLNLYARIPKGFYGCLGRRLGLVRPSKNKVDTDYLFYYFFSPFWRNVIAQKKVSGSTVERILMKKFPRFPVLLPPLTTQRRIASILSAYDNLIENNNKRIRLLEQMAENLYKEWFVRFRFPGHEKVEMENGLPKGWKYERLDTIASINMGQSPPSSFYNEEQKGLPFHQGVGSYGDIYLKDEIYSTQGAKVAESNSIIFSVRAPVGRINITLNKIYLGRGVAAINAINGNNGFLYWSLRSKFAKEDTIGNGAIFSSVTRDELGRQKMIVPDKSTVAKFESIANKMENLIRDITNQNKSLIRQRDLLLPRLMSGKLEVKE